MSLAASPGVKEALAFALSPLFCCEAAIRAELCDNDTAWTLSIQSPCVVGN